MLPICSWLGYLNSYTHRWNKDCWERERRKKNEIMDFLLFSHLFLQSGLSHLQQQLVPRYPGAHLLIFAMFLMVIWAVIPSSEVVAFIQAAANPTPWISICAGHMSSLEFQFSIELTNTVKTIKCSGDSSPYWKMLINLDYMQYPFNSYVR